MGVNRRNNSDGVAVKKRAVRFNFIDVLIILAVLLIAAIVVNMFMPLSFFSKFNKTIERQIQFTVEITALDENFIDKVTENQTVIDAVSKYEIGKVMTVDCNTHYSELQYNESEASGWLSPYADKYNMLVTITVLAEYTEGEGYSVGDRRIAVGEKMSLRFPNFAAEGYCIALSNG
jgi:hypothetical protein